MSSSRSHERAFSPNPLEITSQERKEIAAIRQQACIGKTSRVMQEATRWYQENVNKKMSLKTMAGSMGNAPAFGLFADDPFVEKAFLNTDLVPHVYRNIIMEHEVAELYFRKHLRRAQAIVDALGLHNLCEQDKFPQNTAAHYVGLFCELQVAQNEGILSKYQEFITAFVASQFLEPSYRSILKNNRLLIPNGIPGGIVDLIMQLTGREIVVYHLQ